MDTKIEMKIKEIFGKNLVTIAEYYTGDVINILVVCNTFDFTTLQKLKQLKEIPLILTKEELTDGVDVFPIEFLNIKKHHKIIYGEDFLKDLVISKIFLRHQLEFEFRSKLIHLRREYLQFKGKDFDNLILSVIPTLVPIIGGLLYLKDSDLGDTNNMIRSFSDEYGIDIQVLKEIYDIREGNSKFNKDKEQYIRELIKVLSNIGEIVDELEVLE
ncbi:MAG TPA: hypothetical protein VMW53_06750 [archaeon]|nr:hypothetical protein [archaeon]